MDSNINRTKTLSFLFQVTTDSFTQYFHNTFIVFNSINDILYLVYSNFKNNIICVNLKNNEKICEIINDSLISNYNHYLDEKNKRDLLMTISSQNKEIKIWDMKNIECIFKHNIEGSICSGNFLNDNDNLYLVVNISNFENNEGEISIYDFHQNKIKKIYQLILNISNHMIMRRINFILNMKMVVYPIFALKYMNMMKIL